MARQEKSNLQQNDVFGCKAINPKKCKTCRFSHGDPPFEDAPEKMYCMIFSRDEGEQKPPEVYYEGADCDYYKKDTRK